MNYRPLHNARRRMRASALLAPVAFLALLALFSIAYPAALGSALSRAAAPLWRAGNFLSERVERGAGYVSSHKTLIAENRRLAAELLLAQARAVDREFLLAENTLLRRDVGGGEPKEHGVVGTVLATPPRSAYDTAVIDVGLQDGVDAGDRAFYGATLLGMVVQARRATSVVEILSHAGKKTSATILHGGAAIPVEAEGRGGGEFRATLPKDVPVAEGDPVVLPGQGTPLFATVASVEGSDTSSFRVIRFRSPVSFEQLRFLEIRKTTEF